MRQNYQISEQFPSIQEEEALEFPIFARKKYWLLHLKEEELWPITIRDQEHKIIAFWCFYRIENRFVTPFNAPFFTPYLADETEEEIVFSKASDYFNRKYGKTLQFSFQSDLNFKRLQTLVPSLKILNIEMGTQLIVGKDVFLKQIVQKRKKRKLKSISSTNSFEVMEVSKQNWEKVYRQNVLWRQEKGHQNFMSIEEMQEAKNQFPQSYHAFQVLKAKKLVGAAFFLKVDLDFIYVYSLITAPAVDIDEPSLLLWKALYDWAQSNCIKFIDMGTSMTVKGDINRNLLHYKTLIGGSTYKKYTFEC